MYCNKLKKLMSSKLYRGMCTEVLLESPCFELGYCGEILRHVHIGVTRREFLMAHQTIRDARLHRERMRNPNVDLDLEGFELLCGMPLVCCHFSLWDDRSCRISICTDMGRSYYFELCNVSDGSDARWIAWREYIARREDGVTEFGYKSWTIYPGDHKRTDCSNMKFLKRPAAMCLVGSVGTQACEDFDYFQENKKYSMTDHFDLLTLRYSEGIQKGDDDGGSAWDLIPELYKSIPELKLLGKSRRIVRVASDISLSETSDFGLEKSKSLAVASRSESDLIDYPKYPGRSDDCWKNRIFFMLLQCNVVGASSIISNLFPSWSLSEDKLEEYKKIWNARCKVRPVPKSAYFKRGLESLSIEYFEPIIDPVDRIAPKKPSEKRRRRRHLAEKRQGKRKLIKRVLSNRVMGVFKTHSARR